MFFTNTPRACFHGTSSVLCLGWVSRSSPWSSALNEDEQAQALLDLCGALTAERMLIPLAAASVAHYLILNDTFLHEGLVRKNFCEPITY